MTMSTIKSEALASDYDYDLPKELIAQQPLAVRSDSRLMIVDRQRQSIEHRFFRDLPDFLNEGDALVLNDSRVVPAKLTGYRKETRGAGTAYGWRTRPHRKSNRMSFAYFARAARS